MELLKRIALCLLCLLMVFATACAAPKTENPLETTAAATEVTIAPTEEPSESPTVVPTEAATEAPATKPTTKPTVVASVAPTTKLATAPTIQATPKATVMTAAPTTQSTKAPTAAPTTTPTTKPTTAPTEPTEPDVLDETRPEENLPIVMSQFSALERMIYEKTNAERGKQGLAPLEWAEKAYFFANTRAYEVSVQWSHTRPNGKPFYDVFTEYGENPMGCGENMFKVSYELFSPEYIASSTEELADMAVNSWMESPGHRANILNEEWNSVVIGVYYDGQKHTLYAVQLFLI